MDIVRERNTDNKNRVENGGIVGFLANVTNLISIDNSRSLGNMRGLENMVPSEFINTTEANIQNRLTKCYECSESTGVSNVTENTTGHLETVSNQNLNAQFYKDLGFDEEVCDFTKINEQKCPELK